MIFSYKITHKLLVPISICLYTYKCSKKSTDYKKGNSHLEKNVGTSTGYCLNYTNTILTDLWSTSILKYSKN